MEICKLIVVVVVLYSVGQVATAEEEGHFSRLRCMHKLKKCLPYVHKVDPPPPSSCCDPMKEMVDKEASCICTIFTNPVMLKTLNLTKDNALDLPKACGANPDVSHCSKNDASSPSSSPSGSPKSSNAPSPRGSPKSSNGNRSAPTISFSGFSFLTALVAIIIIFF